MQKNSMASHGAIFKNISKKSSFVFDYEINKIKLEEKEELHSKMYYFDKISKEHSNFN